MKQLDILTNGRARHFSSPPQTICSSRSPSSRFIGDTKLVPTCLVVPEMQA
jgi:hypothetical protein